MDWTFDANDYEEQDFAPLPIGDYRVRVKEVERQTSKTSGNEMIKLTLSVSGKNNLLWHYIVFMRDDPKKTNQMLGAFFNSFGMQPDMNEKNWVGKVGAARVKHEEYNGEPQAKVAYFLARSKQDKLPPWVEPGGGAGNAPTQLPGGPTVQGPDGSDIELPF